MNDRVVQRVLEVVAPAGQDGLRLRRAGPAVADLVEESANVLFELPLPDALPVRLSLQRFTVLTPGSQFVSTGADQVRPLPIPAVVSYRGTIEGDPGSHAFLSFTDWGATGVVNGSDGTRYYIATPPGSRRTNAGLTIQRDQGTSGVPEVAPCGVVDISSPRFVVHGADGPPTSRSAPLLGAPRLAIVAVDADQSFVGLFEGDELEAQAYIVQVIAAVSDIYIRDLDVKLILNFVRLWSAGGEPFGAHDLPGFANWWFTNDDPSPYNLVHLFSGRRDLPYGGVAYVSGPCGGGFGISGLLLGSFPSPLGSPHLGNWDIVVVAHEMGHNMGTFHTHDGYSPPIDQCASGIVSRGTIMSYCHIVPGGLLNTDLRFHGRVQGVIASEVALGGCLPADCNDNGVDDAVELQNSPGSDVNGNGVPDECEDCNGNGQLDSVEIAGGLPDLNGNDLPDVCEPDCNQNGLPDELEVTNTPSLDVNGNLIPDICEADCDGDGVADHVEIRGGQPDFDRDGVPDVCQDCNANGLVDYIDTDRQFHIFVADQADRIREYHRDSGVPVRTLAQGQVVDPYDLTFGPDSQLYASSFGDDRIVRIDVDANVVTDFVTSGSGGLDGPAGLAFGPDGHLYVASNLNSMILRYDGSSGAFLGVAVSAGSGGMTGPRGLTFSPGGPLYVACADHAVRRYTVGGTFLGVFVASGSGGLNDPRDLLLAPSGRLLVSSYGTNNVLEYSNLGAFIRDFTPGIIPTGAWGLELAPDGNVLVVRNSGEKRILEYDVFAGRYLRSFIRGDSALVAPTGLAVRPASPHDCNANRLPDDCDIPPLGTGPDCQPNSVPDECDILQGGSPDVNSNNRPDECECVPLDPAQIEPEGSCLTDSDCLNRSVCVNGGCYVPRNRYLSFSVGAAPVGESLAIKITHPSSGREWWVQGSTPGDPPNLHRLGPVRHCADLTEWPVTMDVTGCGVVPSESYEVRLILCVCDPMNGALYSPPLPLPTTPMPVPRFWADCVGTNLGNGWTPPDGLVNFVDISAAVSRFQAHPLAPPLSWVDLHDQEPNGTVNFGDINLIVSGFQGVPYPYVAPALCP